MSYPMMGMLFGVADSEEQASFFNEAGRTLRRTCPDNNMDLQLCMITNRLDGNGREIIKRLAQFIEADEKTPTIIRPVVYAVKTCAGCGHSEHDAGKCGPGSGCECIVQMPPF